MFARLLEIGARSEAEPVVISVDGDPVTCNPHDLVATALFAAGRLDCRDTVVGGVPRGPFCMMGICYDCLVEIDGMPNRQACMTRVRPGMRVARQRGTRSAA